MSCLLTNWFDLDCNDSIGGIEELYAIENSSITAVTDASGVVTAITTSGSKKFQRYRLKDEVGELKSPVNHNQQNGTTFFEHTLDFNLSQMTTTKRNEMLILARTNATVIAKDNNGRYWMAGRTKGMYPSAGDFTTGKAKGDLNGTSMTLIAREKEPPIEVTSSLINSTLVHGL